MHPELRPYWLAERARLWCYILSRASDRTRFGETDVLREVESHLYGAHMTVLALTHIDRCLSHLRRLRGQFPTDLQAIVDAFTEQYESAHIIEARHALEHEEDRIYGKEPYTSKPYTGDFPMPRITGGKTGSRYLNMINVLDTDYDLGAVIEAALALEAPLGEFAHTLYPESVAGGHVPDSSRSLS